MKWGKFSPLALESIDHSDARTNIWEGAVSSGKTVASIVRWLIYVAEAPPGLLLMVGKTERTLKRNILDLIEEMVGEDRFKHDRSSGEVTLLGRRIYLAGANDERSENKIRGLTLAGAYGDEITLWPEGFYRMLGSRLRVPGAKFFGTTNPDSPFHWLKRSYLDREEELDLKRFSFGLADNLNLDPVYVAALEAEYTGLWYKRFILGLWVVAEGAIYPALDAESGGAQVVTDEVCPPGSAYERVFIGIDYATATTTVFLACGLYRGTWYVFSEWRHDAEATGRQMSDGEQSQEYRDWIASLDLRVWPRSTEIDPSAKSFKKQLKDDGVKSLRDADNSVIDGIRVVATALSAGMLKIHESCTGLLAEMSTYTWDPKAQEKGEDKPIKKHDHGPDALRYLLMRAIGKTPVKVVEKPVGF